MLSHLAGARATSVIVRLCLIFIVAASAASPALAGVAEAEAYLLSRQNADGSIANATDIATATQATAEALAAAELTAQSRDDALAFLDGSEPGSLPTEYLARQIIAVEGANLEALTELASRQNVDGSFGHNGNLLDTAHGLRALAAGNLSGSSTAQRAVGHILNAHTAGKLPGNSNAAVSLQIWHALYPFRHQYAGVTNLLDQLAAAWSAPFVEDFMEARRVRALMLRSTDGSSYRDALDGLRARQLANGSFSDDVYSTALALQVLRLAEKAVPNPDLASVRGRVIDAEYGTPLPGAVVTLRGMSMTTNAKGEFAFDGVDEGAADLVIQLDGFNGLSANIQLAPGQALDLGDLGLLSTSASGALLRGRVQDAASGAGIAAANVVLDSGEESVTDSEGRFTFSGLEAGSLDMTVTAGGYETASKSVNLAEGNVHLVSIALKTTGSGRFAVSGTVTDAQTGAPMADASITLTGDATATATTDSNGRYALAGLPTGYVSLQASKAGYCAANANAQASDGVQLTFSPALESEGSCGGTSARSGMTGIIEDAVTGQPVAGATVTITSVDGATSATAGTDGSFSLDAEPGEYSLVVTAMNYREVSTPVMLNENLVIDYGSILLSPEGYYPAITLSGTILDSATSLPIPAATVTVLYPDHQVTFASDGDGVFATVVDGDRDVQIRAEAVAYQNSGWSLRLPAEDLNMGQIRMRPEGLNDLRPDLELALADISKRSTDPSTLQAGGSIDIDVLNLGMKSLDKPFDVIAYLDVDANGAFSPNMDVEFGRTAHSGTIDGNGSSRIEMALAGELPFRDAPIAFSVDPFNQIPEASEQNNTASTIDFCDVQPQLGELNPSEKFRWTGSQNYPSHDQVMSTPMVAPLYDTDGSGVIDGGDERSIIFISYSGRYYRRSGVVRAISGIDGREIWSVTDAYGRINPAGQVAVGDIDGDGFVEIVVPLVRGLMAFENDGSAKWTNTQIPSGLWDSPAIADIDGDGSSEILFGPYVLDSEGHQLWRAEYPGGPSYNTYAMDLDADGKQEVIAGASVFRSNGVRVWQDSGAGNGWTATADLDGDSTAEIVHVSSGRVRSFSAAGELLWGPVLLPGGGNGGPPTVADMNGDGLPEIGVAGASRYTALSHDGAVLWTAATQDLSSNMTGSSVFDFEGDGKAEVVYADERTVWIFSGANGEVLASIPHTSGTTHEVPVVADVDGDGRAEIVVPANQFLDSQGIQGLRVFEGVKDNWALTRAIWNQQAYSIDNVDENGSIPREPAANWRTHNTYRLNTLPGVDPRASADLTLALLSIRDNGLGNGTAIKARVGNAGSMDAYHTVFSIYSNDPSQGGVLVAKTVIPLVKSGSYIDVEVELPEGHGAAGMYGVLNEERALVECSYQNNDMTLSSVPQLGKIRISADADRYLANEPVQFVSVIENIGTFAGDYKAVLQAEDRAGDIVFTRFPESLGELASGEQRIVEQTWNTGQTLAGSYQVRALLYSANGELLDESVAPFSIAHDADAGPLASLRLTTDRARYHTTDNVRLELRAANESVNTLLGVSAVHLTVTEPAGEVVFDRTLPVRELAPGNAEPLSATQVLQSATVGEYNATASWLGEDGTLLGASQRSFEVFEDLSVALQGTVSVASPQLYVGDAQVCTEAAVNTGTQVANIRLRHTLARLDEPSASSAEPFDASLQPDIEQTWLRGVETAGMNEGDYACVLEAEINGAWQPLANAYFRLDPPPIHINASLGVSDRGRVLVLLDPACADSGEEGECDVEPYGPDFAPSLPIQREHLQAVLENAGWTYTIVTNSADFEAEFRSKGYELYALFNEVVKLPEALQRDVVDDIASGRGLLVSGNHDRRNGRLEEALGIKSLGKNLEVESLVTTPFGDHEGGEVAFNVAHWPNALKLEGAETLGEFRVPQKGKKPSTPEPALTSNVHEKGTGTYAAFDWPAQSAQQGDNGELAGLLTATLGITHPDPYAPVAGRVVSLVLAMQNEGMATPGEVRFALPPGVALVSGPEGASITDGVVHWPFALSEAEQQSAALWLQLPETAGPLTFEAVIYAGEGDSLTEHVRAETVLNVLPQE